MSEILSYGPVALNVELGLLVGPDAAVVLKHREVLILAALIKKPSGLTMADLMDIVYGNRPRPSRGNDCVRQAMLGLRRMLAIVGVHGWARQPAGSHGAWCIPEARDALLAAQRAELSQLVQPHA